MERIISTEDLKAKLNRKESIKVVETLAAERYPRRRHSRSPEYSARKNQGTGTARVARLGMRKSSHTVQTIIDNASQYAARELAISSRDGSR